MTLADERRQIGRNITTERNASNRQAERQAIQPRNTAERRGSSIQQDLNSLTYPEKKTGSLSSIEPRGTLPAQRGSAPYVAPPVAGTGGGIASPVTEQPGTREHYPAESVWSTDGMVALRLGQIKKLTMLDANNAEVVFEFENVIPE